MFKFSRERMNSLGQGIYVERMRRYLYDMFPESEEMPVEKMDQTILKLTERAQSHYGLILETDIAPFIVGAWLMGVDFDEKYLAVKKILSDPNLASFEKSEKLWQFLEDAFRILEEGKK